MPRKKKDKPLSTCDFISSIAGKLNLTEEQTIVLFCVNHIGAGKQGMIRALAILGKLVQKYSLSDSAFEETYGKQLAAKNILTETEGSFFDGTYSPEH